MPKLLGENLRDGVHKLFPITSIRYVLTHAEYDKGDWKHDAPDR